MSGEERAAAEASPPRAASPRPVARSPAHRLHVRLGARFGREAGWEVPAAYGPLDGEIGLVREGLAAADVTARGKLDVRGAFKPLLSGALEGTVAVISDRFALVLTGPGATQRTLAELEGRATGSVMVTDASHLYAGFALAGPRLDDALRRLTSFDAPSLEPGAAAGAPFAEVPGILVRRDLPIPVLEAYVASEYGRYAWETVLETVRGLGGGPVGWEALRAEGWS